MVNFISLININASGAVTHKKGAMFSFGGGKKKINPHCNMECRKAVFTEVLKYSQKDEAKTVMENYFSRLSKVELSLLRLCHTYWFQAKPNQEVLNPKL